MVHNVVAALIVQGDHILLGKRASNRTFYPNVWDTFGGHIEPGEQPVQTLVRELQEELGITPTQWTELEIIRNSVPAQGSMPYHDLIVQLYCVTAWEGRPVNRQPEEHSTIQWFSYLESIQLELAHPAYPRLFEACLQSTVDNRE